MAMTARKRKFPGFQFTLRSLFLIVTALCICLGWLGWNVRQVHQRTWVQESLSGQVADRGVYNITQTPSRQPPALWSLLGAKPIDFVGLKLEHNSEQDVERIQRLFPEAIVMRGMILYGEPAVGTVFFYPENGLQHFEQKAAELKRVFPDCEVLDHRPGSRVNQ